MTAADVPDIARTWLTIPEAATICGRSVRTLNRWIHDGRLNTITLAQLRLVPKKRALDVERDTRRAAHQGRPRPHKTGDTGTAERVHA